MMKITLWGINYSPEQVGISVYNTELCEFLAEAGHQVSVVTGFPYYPAWRLEEADKNRLYSKQVLTGKTGAAITLYRCWLYVPSIPSTLRRIWHETSFVLTSLLRLLTLPAADIYLVVSPPLLLAVAAWLISLLKNAPIVVHVQDLQPDAAASLGMVKPGLFLRFLYALEKHAYTKASLVSSISNEFCETIAKKQVAKSKITHFPNWVTIPKDSELPARGSWKTVNGISSSTRIVSYAGNLGAKQGLESLINVAEILKNKDNLLFVVAGNGSFESALKKMAQEKRLKNIIFRDILPTGDHTALLIDSSVCLIPQKAGSSANFFPSKLLKILSLSRPIVTNAEPGSALFEAVRVGAFGAIVSQNDNSMADCLISLLDDENKLNLFGEAGRIYVSQFEKRLVLENFMNVLSKLVGKDTRANFNLANCGGGSKSVRSDESRLKKSALVK